MKPTCQAPKCRTETDLTLCNLHTRRLEQCLAELPAWLHELTVTITRQDRIERGTVTDLTLWDESCDDPYLTDVTLVANPLPFAWAPADLYAAAHSTLVTWARHLSESRGLPLTTIDPAAWLTAHVASIAVDVAGGQCYDELTSLAVAIARACDRRPPRQYVGKCDEGDVRFEMQGETLYAVTGECGADLYAAEGAEEVVCPACGLEYNVLARRRSLLDLLDDRWATAMVIADGLTGLDLPVTAGTIRTWASRAARRRAAGAVPLEHEIHQVGVDDEGRPVYRVGDVRARVEAGQETVRMRAAEKAYNRKRAAA